MGLTVYQLPRDRLVALREELTNRSASLEVKQFGPADSFAEEWRVTGFGSRYLIFRFESRPSDFTPDPGNVVVWVFVVGRFRDIASNPWHDPDIAQLRVMLEQYGARIFHAASELRST